MPRGLDFDQRCAGSVALTMHAAFRSDRHIRDQSALDLALGRFAAQLRGDAHEAQSAKTLDSRPWWSAASISGSRIARGAKCRVRDRSTSHRTSCAARPDRGTSRDVSSAPDVGCRVACGDRPEPASGFVRFGTAAGQRRPRDGVARVSRGRSRAIVPTRSPSPKP